MLKMTTSFQSRYLSITDLSKTKVSEDYMGLSVQPGVVEVLTGKDKGKVLEPGEVIPGRCSLLIRPAVPVTVRKYTGFLSLSPAALQLGEFSTPSLLFTGDEAFTIARFTTDQEALPLDFFRICVAE